MKKLIALFTIIFLLLSALPLNVAAASYPLIFFDRTESTLTIPEGESGLLKFTIFPEYHNERYNVEIYDSDGYLVGSASNSYYNTDGTFTKDISINVDTYDLELDLGKYKIVYWMEFYSFYRWNEAPNRYTDYFEVIADTCNGNHDYSLTYTVTEATCKEEGEGKYVCNNCGHTIYKSIPSGNHNYGSWTNYSETSHSRTCKECSHTEIKSHEYDSGTVVKEATCIQEGSKKYTCTKCKATKTTKIPMLTTHSYDNYYDSDCNGCGFARESKEFVAGDANCDGFTNSLDAAFILKYDSGLIDIDLSYSFLADVSKDDTVNSLDAAKILKYDAGIIPSL